MISCYGYLSSVLWCSQSRLSFLDKENVQGNLYLCKSCKGTMPCGRIATKAHIYIKCYLAKTYFWIWRCSLNGLSFVILAPDSSFHFTNQMVIQAVCYTKTRKGTYLGSNRNANLDYFRDQVKYICTQSYLKISDNFRNMMLLTN